MTLSYMYILNFFLKGIASNSKKKYISYKPITNIDIFREDARFAELELPGNRSTAQFLINMNNDEMPISLLNISGHNLLLAFWIQVIKTKRRNGKGRTLTK